MSIPIHPPPLPLYEPAGSICYHCGGTHPIAPQPCPAEWAGGRGRGPMKPRQWARYANYHGLTARYEPYPQRYEPVRYEPAGYEPYPAYHGKGKGWGKGGKGQRY